MYSPPLIIPLVSLDEKQHFSNNVLDILIRIEYQSLFRQMGKPGLLFLQGGLILSLIHILTMAMVNSDLTWAVFLRVATAIA